MRLRMALVVKRRQQARASFFDITRLYSAVLHAVYFDAVSDGYYPTDDLEGLLIRAFAIHDMRCGLSIDLVSALEQVPDWIQGFVERLEWPRQFFPLASGKVIPPPLDHFAVPVLGGVVEDLKLLLEVKEENRDCVIFQRIPNLFS